MDLDVRSNMTLSYLNNISKMGILNFNKEKNC